MKTFTALLTALVVNGAAIAQEAPPPPVEPYLPPGSRLVEPRVDALVSEMADLLANTQSFSLEAEEIFDEVPENSPRIQLSNQRSVSMKRPDRLIGVASGDAINRTVWYDGQTFSSLDQEQNVYAVEPVSSTIDAALDEILERTGMVVPLADFLYSDVYDRLMESVQRGVYLGIHQAGGVACHHLSFQQETIDWQLWIDAGEQPLPRKLVIAYKTEDEVPQYTVTIPTWNLDADLSEELFRFEPPESATKVELPTFLAEASDEAPKEEKP